MDSFSSSYLRQILDQLFALVDQPDSEDYFMTVQVLIERICSHPLIYLSLKETLKKHDVTEPYQEYVDDLVRNFEYFLKAFYHICSTKQLDVSPYEFSLLLKLGGPPCQEWSDVQLMNAAREMNVAVQKTGVVTELDRTVESELSSLALEPLIRNLWALSEMRIAQKLPQRQHPFSRSWDKLIKEISDLALFQGFVSARTRIDCREGFLSLVGYLLNKYGFLGPAEVLARDYPEIFQYRRDFVISDDYSPVECDRLLQRLRKRLGILLTTTWSIEANLETYAVRTVGYSSERIRRLLNQEADSTIKEKELQLDLAEYLFDRGIAVMTEKIMANDRVDIVAFHGIDLEIVEVKLFKKADDLERVLDGVRQTAAYIRRHQRYSGYFVVYETCEEVKLSLPREYVTESMRIRIIVIDLVGRAATSDSRVVLDASQADLDYWVSWVRPALVWNNLSIAKLITIHGIGVATARHILNSVTNTIDMHNMHEKLGTSIMEKVKGHIIFPD